MTSGDLNTGLRLVEVSTLAHDWWRSQCWLATGGDLNSGTQLVEISTLALDWSRSQHWLTTGGDLNVGSRLVEISTLAGTRMMRLQLPPSGPAQPSWCPGSPEHQLKNIHFCQYNVLLFENK